jgi:HSP20 family protein
MQLILGDNLDTEHLNASYRAGVLRLEVPVAEEAKPRKVAVKVTEDQATLTGTGEQHEASAAEEQREVNA